MDIFSFLFVLLMTIESAKAIDFAELDPRKAITCLDSLSISEYNAFIFSSTEDINSRPNKSNWKKQKIFLDLKENNSFNELKNPLKEGVSFSRIFYSEKCIPQIISMWNTSHVEPYTARLAVKIFNIYPEEVSCSISNLKGDKKRYNKSDSLDIFSPTVHLNEDEKNVPFKEYLSFFYKTKNLIPKIFLYHLKEEFLNILLNQPLMSVPLLKFKDPNTVINENDLSINLSPYDKIYVEKLENVNKIFECMFEIPFILQEASNNIKMDKMILFQHANVLVDYLINFYPGLPFVFKIIQLMDQLWKTVERDYKTKNVPIHNRIDNDKNRSLSYEFWRYLDDRFLKEFIQHCYHKNQYPFYEYVVKNKSGLFSFNEPLKENVVKYFWENFKIIFQRLNNSKFHKGEFAENSDDNAFFNHKKENIANHLKALALVNSEKDFEPPYYLLSDEMLEKYCVVNNNISRWIPNKKGKLVYNLGTKYKMK